MEIQKYRNRPLAIFVRLPFLAIIAVAALLQIDPPASATDWPMYRADSARSGYTSDILPPSLSLAWTYRGPAPMPAWPGNDRLTFDRANQPVIAGSMLFFGSSADGKIYALDAATGTVRWTYYTDAPVRFAPVVWQNRVFIAGDDGWLVCLNAADGRLFWRQRLAPRPDLLLGNDRMISRWPARGGPVLADGVLYVGSGIWPTEGVFIHAIDPASGKVLWCNDSSGGIEMDQPHPGARARSGVAAHGYLAVQGRDLLVPTGRAVPAVFNRRDGEFKSFPLATYLQKGGADVIAFDGQQFNHGRLFSAEKNVQPQTIGPQMGLHPRWVLAARRDRLSAYDRAHLWTAGRQKDADGKETAGKVLAKPLWTLTLPHPAEAAMIVAGDKLAAGGSDHVSLVNLTTQQVTWTAEVDGAAYGLAAAGGNLYVSTDKGLIYCFQDARQAGSAPRTETTGKEDGVGVRFPSLNPDIADEVLRRASLRDGFCLDLGCGDGQLTLALARRSTLRIFAVDPDPANVQRLRLALEAEGLYGWRAMVYQADLANVPFPRWFADLIVSGRSITAGETAVPASALNRFLRPCGGIACLGQPGAMKLSTRGPLDGTGQWTHQYADLANTVCSDDALVKGPLSMLWFRDSDEAMPNRHGRGPAPLVVDGRMFVEGLDALRALSIYNGRTLWQLPLPGILKRYHQDHLVGTAATGSNLCEAAGRIYLAHDDRCMVLSAIDGSKLAEFAAPTGPAGKPGTWGFLACDGKALFGSLANDKHLVSYRYKPGDMSEILTESRVLFALDATTGRPKWSLAARDSIRHNAIAIGAGRIYLIDRPLAEMDGPRFPPSSKDVKPKPQYPTHAPGRLVALNAETGQPLWQLEQGVFGTLLAYSPKHDALLMAYQPGSFQLTSEKGGRMAAFRAADGQPLWDASAKYSTRPILVGRTIYALPGAWNLLTGRPVEVGIKRSHGCGTAAASQNMLFFRSATIGYIDLASPKITENYGGIRPGCWINTIPAGGLLLMPDSTAGCECSYLNQASIALQPAE